MMQVRRERYAGDEEEMIDSTGVNNQEAEAMSR
jgi:hypothetical protein